MRPWILWPLVLCISCSDGGTHSGSLPEPADFLPTIIDSFHASASASADAYPIEADSSEQPRLILRCEQGQVNAYIIAGAPESAEADAHKVPVLLDSAATC